MKSKKIFISVIVFILIISALMLWNKSKTKNYSYGIYTQNSIDYAKTLKESSEESNSKAYEQLISLADKALQDNIDPITFLRIPPAYENTQGHIDASRPLTQDAYNAYVLSLAWKLTDKQEYANKAEKILDAWAKNNKLISHKEDTPLVSSYGGIGLINAALLLKDEGNWDQSSFQKSVEFTYLPPVKTAKKLENNWADWGNLASLTSYSYLENEKEFKKEVKFTKHLINTQIGVDGEMLGEISRKENGMFYTYFSLAPLTQSIYLIYNQTEVNMFDIHTSEGSKVKRALDYYYYFVEHPNEWPYYREANLSKPNNYWPNSLYEAMSGIYPESNYDSFVSKSRPILGGYLTKNPHHIAWSFPTLMKPNLEKASQ